MFSGTRGRLILIIAVCGVCVWALVGPMLKGDEGSPLKLGLDLQGGTHLVLQVHDPDGAMSVEARTDAAARALEIIRNRVDQFGVSEPAIQQVGEDRIIVELAGIQDVGRAKAIIQQTAFLEFKILTDGMDFTDVLPLIDSIIVAVVGEEALPEAARGETGQSLDELFQSRDSADAGTASSQRELRPLTRLLLDSGESGIFLVEEPQVGTVREYLAIPEVRQRLPRGIDLVWGSDMRGVAGKLYRPVLVLDSEPLITGEYLADAQANRDPLYNQPIVTFQLTRVGGRIFERGTRPKSSHPWQSQACQKAPSGATVR